MKIYRFTYELRFLFTLLVFGGIGFSLPMESWAEGRKSDVKSSSWLGSFSDSRIGSFVLPSERNKRDRERILSVLAYDGAIGYDSQGRPEIRDLTTLTEYYKDLNTSGAIDSVYGYGSKQFDGDLDNPHAVRTKATDFWNNFLKKKDMADKDVPEALDPFANDSRGLATKIHARLRKGIGGALKYSTTAGELGERGIDVLNEETRRGVVAGADAFIKSMDVLTRGKSTLAVEWAEAAAKFVDQASKDPVGAAKDYIASKIREEISNKLTKSFKEKMGEDKYNEMMEKYSDYNTEREKMQKLMEDMHKVTGDSRFGEVAKTLESATAENMADQVAKKILPPELGGDPKDKKKEDQKAEAKKDEKKTDDADLKDEVASDEKDKQKQGDKKDKDKETKETKQNTSVDRDKAGMRKDNAEKEKDAREKGTQDKSAVAALPEPESAPDGARISIKGYVEGEDGSRITIVETRDADGNLIEEADIETDADGNEIGRTTYTGESGEGKPSSKGLKGLEGEDGEVDLPAPDKGDNVMEDLVDARERDRDEAFEDSAKNMEHQQKFVEAENAGYENRTKAKSIREFGAGEAAETREKSASDTAAANRENSLGKTMGDAFEDAVKTGMEATGKSFGSTVGQKLAGEIFNDDDKEVTTSGGGTTAQSGPAPAPGKRNASAGKSVAAPASEKATNTGTASNTGTTSKKGGMKTSSTKRVGSSTGAASGKPVMEKATCACCGYVMEYKAGTQPPRNCPKCGCKTSSTLVECAKCGCQWMVPPGGSMTCPYCGFDNSADTGGGADSDKPAIEPRDATEGDDDGIVSEPDMGFQDGPMSEPVSPGEGLVHDVSQEGVPDM